MKLDSVVMEMTKTLLFLLEACRVNNVNCSTYTYVKISDIYFICPVSIAICISIQISIILPLYIFFLFHCFIILYIFVCSLCFIVTACVLLVSLSYDLYDHLPQLLIDTPVY